MDGATVTGFCNVIAAEHKYSDSLPVNEAHNYKIKSNKSKRYTQILYENHSLVYFSLKSFSLIDLSIGGGLVDATPMCYSSPQFILQESHL